MTLQLQNVSLIFWGFCCRCVKPGKITVIERSGLKVTLAVISFNGTCSAMCFIMHIKKQSFEGYRVYDFTFRLKAGGQCVWLRYPPLATVEKIYIYSALRYILTVFILKTLLVAIENTHRGPMCKEHG